MKDGQLEPKALEQAAKEAGREGEVEVRMQEGYDHSYFFVSIISFMVIVRLCAMEGSDGSQLSDAQGNGIAGAAVGTSTGEAPMFGIFGRGIHVRRGSHCPPSRVHVLMSPHRASSISVLAGLNLSRSPHSPRNTLPGTPSTSKLDLAPRSTRFVPLVCIW